ncbi:MAG: hypothetical protein JWQ15_663, partial [Marmoricola sp.]|nr:hypothetical protein [Marmoricola sp.]
LIRTRVEVMWAMLLNLFQQRY